MEPVVETDCSGGLSPARGREASLHAAGRIAFSIAWIKMLNLNTRRFVRGACSDFAHHP